MRLLYTLLWYALLPALFFRLWWRGRRAPAYRSRWRERLGLYRTPPVRGCVWIHAVSVGETVAAAPMIEALLARHPDMPLLVTTTTPTGSERVRALFGDRVLHVYAPWDLPGALTRLFRHFRPRLVLLLETELWPNTIAAAARRRVPVVLLNGRLSEKSRRGYARLMPLVRPMLACLDAIAAQSEADAARFVAIGARPERVHVTGSVKFDIDIDLALRQEVAQLRQRLGPRPVWIAASTHRGEDERVLAAHRLLRAHRPEALLILVPRHPERFDDVAALCAPFGVARRSRDPLPTPEQGVWLGDTMGELMRLYGCAEVAFVGGSLVPVGGHNFLEPACWGLPLLSGPHLHNFAVISQLLREADALTVVPDEHALAAALRELLDDRARMRGRGEAAAAVVAAHRGALQRVLSLVSSFWPG